VKLSVEPADQGTVAYAGATYRDGDSIEAEAPADLALAVVPAEGYEVESVTVIRTAAPLEGTDAPAAAPGAGQAAPLEADAAGAYVVNADAEAATYRQGSTGAQVRTIQDKLKRWGYYDGAGTRASTAGGTSILRSSRAGMSGLTTTSRPRGR